MCLPCCKMYPVAAVPNTPARTPAVLDIPNNTPWTHKFFKHPISQAWLHCYNKAKRDYLWHEAVALVS